MRVGETVVAPFIPDAVYSWADRVVTNGGLYPSSSTIYAVGAFYQGLIDYSLLSELNIVNCFVPDNLVACRTPLVVGIGSDPWTNVNFATSDLTID